MIRKELYKKILEQWKTESQLSLMIEECAELIKAIQKFNHRGGCLHNVIEELADVEIMCEQMRFIFNPVSIDRIKTQKLARLEKLICQ